MNIKYWSGFSKRKNSTKQPTGGTDCAVVLKEDTSILQPAFIVSTIPDTVNYIQAFGRYYFVTDIVRNINGAFEVQCTVDELASYKSNIGATSALVEYTSSSNNIMITDPRNRPTFETIEKYGDLFDLSNIGFNLSGSYVVGIVSDAGINYYAMTKAQFTTLCTNLYDHTFAAQISNDFYDMKNCIVSCVWMPYTPVGGAITPIFLGGVNEIGGGYLIPESARIRRYPVGSVSFTKPATDLGYNLSYLDYAPYSEGALYLPFVGNVPLDLDIYAEQSSLRILLSIDQFTGDIVYVLMRGAGDVISSYQGNFGVSVPIAGQSYNALGAMGSSISLLGGAATAIGGAITGNAGVLGGGLASVASGSITMAQSLSKHTQINGSLSSAVSAGLHLIIMYHIITRKPAETNLTACKSILGMPYFKQATISSLSGFIKCAGASVNIDGSPEEKDGINSYLNSGFYYE